MQRVVAPPLAFAVIVVLALASALVVRTQSIMPDPGAVPIAVSAEKGDTIVAPGPELPSLDRFIVSDSITGERRVELIAAMQNIVAAMQGGVVTTAHWLDLASMRRIAGDYEGAGEIWEYLTVINPDGYVAYINLGDLYKSYLKNPARAEGYYRKAVGLNPTYIPAYLTFHELYRYAYPAKEHLADDILFEALQKTENRLAILIPLGEYYESVGNAAEARKYFTEARDEANRRGETTIVLRINENLDRLNRTQ